MKARYFLVLLFLWQSISFCQLVGPIVLDGKKVKTLTVVDNSSQNILVVGTESSGMVSLNYIEPDPCWVQTFSAKSFSCVYAQSVSPSLTKLFMAVVPDSSIYNTLIYTNLMPIQSAILVEDSGLDKSKVKVIKSLAGFSFTAEDSIMPAYCCTNDPNIYINKNRVWTVTWAGSKTVTLNFVYTIDSTVWAGGFNNGAFCSALLLKSTDYGETWENLILPIGEIFSCYSICASPGNSDIIFVGLNENILKSTDKGKTWKVCLSNINDVVFTSLAENPLIPGHIFAGGRTNDNSFIFYKSNDGGENWEQVILYCNCIVKGINDMAGIVNDNQFQLFIATDGSGMWKYYDKVSPVEREEVIDNRFYLYQNYPNPFNPVTRISFEFPEGDKVTLKIYDLVGKEIAVLFNGIYKPAGFYTVAWDSKNLQGNPAPSGVYICRLVCGDQTRIIKMTLTR